MANPSFRRILLIGLGGSGQKIVLHLKRRFLETYRVVPPSVKMLCLDTDAAPVRVPSASGEREFSLDPHEFLHIKVDQPEDFITGTPHVGTWFVKPMPAGAITAGAGAVRQNGRLGLFHNLTIFLNRVNDICIQLTDADLDRKMANAKRELRSTTDFDLSVKETEIYVCGSLAGGTGSGTFLDVGILLRDMMPRALIHGFFMLDWLYRRNAFALRVGGNVYAALAELDDLQSITYGSETFVPYQVNYGRKTIKVEKPPYTLFHLIDGRNEVGENIADPGQVSEMIASAIYLSVGELGPAIASVVDNLVTHIGIPAPRVWQGKYARYSSLGVSCICYPAKALHRLVSTREALKLCKAAIAEAQGASAGTQLAAHTQTARSDVEELVKALRLVGEPLVKPLLDEVEPKLNPPEFAPPTSYQVSDPSFPAMLEQQQMDEEQECERAARASFGTHAQPLIENAVATVAKKVQQIEGDRSLSAAYRREWASEAAVAFERLDKRATEQLNAQKQKVAELRALLKASLHRAGELKSAWLRNPRLPACQGWAEKVRNELLPEFRREVLLREAAVLFARLGSALQSRAPAASAQGTQVVAALTAVEARLQRELEASSNEIEDIKKKTNHILLSGGSALLPPELRQALKVEDEVQEVPDEEEGGLLKPVVTLRYEVFKRSRDIKVSDDYLAKAAALAERGQELWELFMNYARERLAAVAEVDVEAALESCAEQAGRSSRDYKIEKFNHLFRLASPLWCYARSLLDAVRQQHYDRILNIGVTEKSRGEKRYDDAVKEIKAKYGIAAGHTFNTTHDPERIWLLGYAAALPAYFVQTLQESRTDYEEEISPPYHVDKYFETEVPDIFPVADADNVALRVLGMAIVPDIDLILDEKQERGHKFICRDEEVRKLSSDDDRVWHLFREMYQDVRSRPDLRDILRKRLIERVESKSQTDVEALKLGDLKSTAGIVGLLKNPGEPRLRELAAALSEPTRAAMAGYAGGAVPPELERRLLDDCNALLKRSACLLSDSSLAEMRLPPATKELLDRHRKEGLKGQDLMRLNRLLLQQALAPHVGRSLRSAIEDYVAKVDKKLAERDFTRLVSARLTYREVAALKAFLSTKAGGYEMKIERYIAGK
jgi:hypothetical protein